MYRNLPHNVTRNTYDKIQKLFDKYTYEYEFDREDVEELLNLKKTRAAIRQVEKPQGGYG